MLSGFCVTDFTPPKIDREEIFRYALTKNAGEKLNEKLDELLNISLDKLSYKVCFGTFPLSITGDLIDMGFCKVYSKDLSKLLSSSQEVVIFGATIGIEIDKLINKYSKISPSDALILHAIGVERIESLANAFCLDYQSELSKNGLSLTSRFSPGYGDLPLTMQVDIFKALSLEKNIMLTLNDSLLMSPTKSVTAIMGIKKCDTILQNDCNNCNNCKSNCMFRKN